jgi:hypothetical protein
MATQQAVRRWIMTGAVAAVTITGTFYGAGLKGEHEVKQVCHALLSTQRLCITFPSIILPSVWHGC